VGGRKRQPVTWHSVMAEDDLRDGELTGIGDTPPGKLNST